MSDDMVLLNTTQFFCVIKVKMGNTHYDFDSGF